MLKIENLSFSYSDDKPLLEEISLELEKEEIIAILGASGSGKSSLLKVIAGLLPVKKGHLFLEEEDITKKECYQRGIGLVFQDYALFPHLNVEKNIGFALKKKEKQRIAEFLRLIHLEGYEAKYPHQLSGGEKQRVAIARALAADPKVLLLDEPFSNLDEELKESVRKELVDLLKKKHCTSILVTHDKKDAYAMANRILYMEKGRIVKEEKIERKKLGS